MRWSVAAVVLAGACGAPAPSFDEGSSTTNTPVEAASTDGRSTSAGDSEAGIGSGSSSSSTGAQEPFCALDLQRQPSLSDVHDVSWTGSHAAGSLSGEFYLAGVEDDDVRLTRIDEAGAELWSATWGNRLGWRDVPTGLHPVDEGVFVSGVSGLYPSPEYPWTGTSFVRGYSHGGVVRWTWEDSIPSYAHSFGRNDGPAIALGPDVIMVATPVLEGESSRVGVRMVALSRDDGTEQARAEFDAPAARPLAAWIDETGVGWIAVATDDGSVMLRWAGAEPPSVAASSGDHLFGYAEFDRDGTVVALASAWSAAGDLLRLSRYTRSLELVAEEEERVEGFRNTHLLDAVVTFGCAGELWVAFNTTTARQVVAVDADLDKLWVQPGLGSVAVSQEHVLFAGYDVEREVSAIWQMEWPE